MADDLARVLVVDDERFFREAIGEIVEGDGFEILLAENGEDALGLVVDPAIGVVILDIRLPGIDGIEVLRRLRDLRPGLRVIMLSASTDQELVLEALRLGACDYLAKPLHDEELVLAVRRAMDAYTVSTHWTRLSSRLDRLVARMEELGDRVRAASDASERFRLLTDGGAELAATVLEAGKSSLMLLDEGGAELRVAAAHGRTLSPEEMDPVSIGFGVAGVVLERSEPMVVESADADERFSGCAPLGRYESSSFAVAPLVSGERRIGVLCATDRLGGGTFGDEDLALLRLLAMQLSELLVARAASPTGSDTWDAEPGGDLLLEDDLEDDRTAPLELDAVDGDAELARRICDAIVTEVEPERVLTAALEPVVEILSAAPVSVFLIDGATGRLRRECEHDGCARSDRKELAPDAGLTAAVAQSGQIIATPDPSADHRFDPEVDTPEDGVAGPYLCVPLKLRGKTVGILRAFPREGGAVSARTGEVVASAASAAIRSVLLYRSLVDSIEEVAEARRKARGA